MTIFYFKYIRPSELSEHRKQGWRLVGKMRGERSIYEGENHDSLIVRKRTTGAGE